MSPLQIAGAAALLLIGSMVPSHAAEQPTDQWKEVALTFADLVHIGFRIVAVTDAIHEPTKTPGREVNERTFILQKSDDVYKCGEVHAVDYKTGDSTAVLYCSQLVQPYIRK